MEKLSWQVQEDNFDRVEVDNFGTKLHFKGNKLHRLDGPAAEYMDGSKFWLQNGKLHRLDGPAIEKADGYKAWYQDGNRHRLDGPAIEWGDGIKHWYINDEEYSEEEFNEKVKNLNKLSWRTPDDIYFDYNQRAPNFRYGGIPFAYSINKELYIGQPAQDHSSMVEFVSFLGEDLYKHVYKGLPEDADAQVVRDYLTESIKSKGYYGRVSLHKDEVAFWYPQYLPIDQNLLMDCIFDLQQKGLLNSDPDVHFSEGQTFKLSELSGNKLSWQQIEFETHPNQLVGWMIKVSSYLDTDLPLYCVVQTACKEEDAVVGTKFDLKDVISVIGYWGVSEEVALVFYDRLRPRPWLRHVFQSTITPLYKVF